MKDSINKIIVDFCEEFIQAPYLCYTEHGLHALFYCKLYNSLSKKDRYAWTDYEGKGRKKVCTIQKEYCTASDLGKGKRQHWDICLLKKPLKSAHDNNHSYDYLRIDCAIEFGMNATYGHIEDDIDRLSHKESNVDEKYAVHLYRISDHQSGRDLNPKSQQITNNQEQKDRKKIEKYLKDKECDVTVYWGIADTTNKSNSRLWRIDKTGSIPIYPQKKED